MSINPGKLFLSQADNTKDLSLSLSPSYSQLKTADSGFQYFTVDGGDKLSRECRCTCTHACACMYETETETYSRSTYSLGLGKNCLGNCNNDAKLHKIGNWSVIER